MNNEIPTPINGIAGMTERFPDTATNSFLQGTESPLSLAGDALDLSKIETGTLNFEKVDFDLRSTVETVAKQLDEDARVKNV
jgi:signal transduction histidine kinase